MTVPYEIFIGLRYLRAKRRNRTISLNTFVSIAGITLGVAALIGTVGIMTGFGYPEILVEIHRKFSSGDVEGATAVFDRYCPLIRFENQAGINLTIRKWVYAMRGAIASPQPREPYPR